MKHHKNRKRNERKKSKAAWQLQKQQKREDAQLRKLTARYPLNVLKQDVQERSCGGCTACCTAVAVTELDKPVWTKCQHECETGCAIYEDRPAACKHYYCFWQVGFLKGEDTRPDKLGIIIDALAVGSIGNALSVWELHEGAANTPKVRDILTRLAERFVICIRFYNTDKRGYLGTERCNSFTVQWSS